MIEANDILEPLKLYNSQIKDIHHENVTEFFEDLVKKSGVSEEENETLVKTVNKKKATLQKHQKAAKKKKGVKTLLTLAFIFSIIIAAILILVGVFTLNDGAHNTAMILCIVGGVIVLGLGIFALVYNIRVVKKALKSINENVNKSSAELNDAIEIAKAQLAPLNSLFDNNMPATLFTNTIPLIQMDQYFDRNKFLYLQEHYGFTENVEPNISSVFIQSGSILGNPFLVERNYVQEMGSHTYIGHLTISYTVTIPDGKGGSRRITKTETLTASVTKPKPYYYLDTWLVYSNDAAPKLNFSRKPSNANSMNEKQMAKYVKDYEKDLNKKVEKARSKGQSFTAMGNTEFEAFFNATNRDNDVEFRLLFTPLAQKNMLSLIQSKAPYGDDFSFIKKGPLNFIKTNHSQTFNYDAGADKFTGYDLKEMRNGFVNFNDDYFKSLYFDLAPLMCIPLYQQHQTFEFIYEGKFATNLSSFETEISANKFGADYFKHPDSETPAILKRKSVSVSGKADQTIITAHSFKTVRHVDYIPKMGGDGMMHNVPVEWYEYIPLEQDTEFTVQECQTTDREFNEELSNGAFDNIVSKYGKNNAILYHKGVISFLATSLANGYQGEEITNIFKREKEN